MYSQCPECLTRFRVTAAALRLAHGTVRCGRCGSAFDALPRLSDSAHDADLDTGPQPPSSALLGASAGGAATAAGLLDGDVPEFQLSADEIERLVIDVRDWQMQFGPDTSPAERAGQRGDTSSAELQQMFEAEFTVDAEGDAPPTASDPRVWVHEPEAVEDITLEGERIQIEGFAGFEEDFLEREIEKELEEQQRAEMTGSHRALPPIEGEALVDDAEPHADIEPLHDVDSADQFKILADVPESAYPAEGAADDAEESSPHALPAVPATPAVVVAAAAGLASDSFAAPPTTARAGATDLSRLPPERPAAPWRRVAEAAARDAATDVHEPDPQLAEDLAAAAGARTTSLAWGVGALLLALVLSAQWVHHSRLRLARDVNVGPALRMVYERIGQPLPPNWNLGAFELRQWGANDAAPAGDGAMIVRASIRNGADFAQPMPLLRLELEDRFGGTVARRDFTAREYLQNPAQAGRLLAAGTATEAELAVVDAPADAVGYRLDVCLREDGTGVRCAQDAGANRAAQ